MSDQAIKEASAPRVTLADVEAAISSEYFFRASDGVIGKAAFDQAIKIGFEPPSVPGSLVMITFCVLILKNGCQIVGVNYGAIHVADFNAEKARDMARKAAVDQIWPLLGYQLRSDIQDGLAHIG